MISHGERMGGLRRGGKQERLGGDRSPSGPGKL
jgi:hypothetical protein